MTNKENGISETIYSDASSPEEKRSRLVTSKFVAPTSRVAKRLGAAGDKKVSSDQQEKPSTGYLQVKTRLHHRLLNELESKRILDSGEEEIAHAIFAFTDRVLESEDLALNNHERRILADDLIQETLGVGPLAPLMHDPSISDILVNDFKTVYIERFGRLEKTSITFRDESHLSRIIQRIVNRVGRRLDESCPMVDARLPDGSRVNATMPPISIDGPTLSIRRFGTMPYKFAELQDMGMFSAEMAQFLAACIKARMNILISGGGGVGKSTFLSGLTEHLPNEERVITIEDAAELNIAKPNVVRFETREANAEGIGKITTRMLVVNSLRMRPDRIIVGEVRSDETLDMLQAMNTGHEGSMTTVHSNSTKDALSRLETMVLLAGTDLPSRAIREQIAAAIQIVIHIRRYEDGVRRIEKISEIESLDDTQFIMNDLFQFEHQGVENQRVKGHFRSNGRVSSRWESLKLSNPELDSNLFKSLEAH